MINPEDLDHCEQAIRHGSRSFHSASLLLPRRVRDPAMALYAFCRLADDAVDLGQQKADAVLRLHERLDLAYAGTPLGAPADRAFTAMIDATGMPRTLPEALLEGLAWDAMGRRYETLSELRAYSARVASAVGVMMCVLMDVRDADALARACDLGVAMQLTNIARDVGEDAREGRLYLPADWLTEAGIEPDALLAEPRMIDGLDRVVRRLLREADRLYLRSEAGVVALPISARPGIFAARFIYAGIGRVLERRGIDPFSYRARTGTAEKLSLLGLATLRAGATLIMPRSAVVYAPALPETAFLVEATARYADQQKDWSEALYTTLSTLKQRDAARREALRIGRDRHRSAAWTG